MDWWVTEFRWANVWVIPTWPAPTQEAFIATQVSNQFGFFDNGLQVGTPSASETCKITRYSWYTNRLGPVILPGTPTPIATPVSNVGYSSLYWYFTLTRSYVGNAYVDFGDVTPTPTP
jgi:hypothetical protein